MSVENEARIRRLEELQQAEVKVWTREHRWWWTATVQRVNLMGIEFTARSTLDVHEAVRKARLKMAVWEHEALEKATRDRDLAREINT